MARTRWRWNYILLPKVTGDEENKNSKQLSRSAKYYFYVKKFLTIREFINQWSIRTNAASRVVGTIYSHGVQSSLTTTNNADFNQAKKRGQKQKKNENIYLYYHIWHNTPQPTKIKTQRKKDQHTLILCQRERERVPTISYGRWLHKNPKIKGC